MARGERAAARAKALKRVDGLRQELLACVRTVLANRTRRCSKGCPGYCPGSYGPEVCDECASLNGYSADIGDAEIGYLPEARQLQRDADYAMVEGTSADPGNFDVTHDEDDNG